MTGTTNPQDDIMAADGAEVSTGRYVTFWVRQGDGSWRVSLDTGVPD